MSALLQQNLSIADWATAVNSTVKYAEFSTDPVALAAASYRLHKTTGVYWADLKDVIPTAEDYTLANNIRDYYTKKLTMARLRGNQISKFREKLGAFLVGNHRLETNELGLLYRLPFFYEEDRAIDSIVDATVSVADPAPEWTEMKLTPLMYYTQGRKNRTITMFVFKDQQGHAVMWPVMNNNPLLSVVVGLHASKSITIAGYQHVKMFWDRSHNYIMIGMPKLVSIESSD